MLKIIEKAFSSHPVRIFAKPGVQLIAGYVGTLVDFNGYTVCDICGPQQSPFGIIGKSKLIKSENVSFNKKDFVDLWPQRMIFRTDNFEHSNYGPGDRLYVGESGMLTNEPIGDYSSFVARLTGWPDDKRSYYEALWI